MRLDSLLKTTVAAGRASNDLRKLAQATRQVEAGFVKEMVATMRRGIPEHHFGSQFGGDAFRDMFDQALSDAVTGRSGLGLARELNRATAPEVIRQELHKMEREIRAQVANRSEKTK